MATLKFDLSKNVAPIRPMSCVNNGPVHKRHANDQSTGGTFLPYKAARIPYARNHDAAFCASYGGEHTVDISAIFPNFDADVNDPASYDFACTDEYTLATLEAGTKTYYRLGQKIEHYIKKFHIFPPKDFKKWAEICEHIIRHFTEGWADGYHLDMPYWEIWNEPDLDDGQEYKRTWAGTKQEFFELYEITAKHLKKCFPHLKIGGPAVAGNMEWSKEFLLYQAKVKTPMDFFSWHIYCVTPEKAIEKAKIARRIMDEAGYTEAESILNEWNYVEGWSGETFYRSKKMIAGIKGAAFTMATMIASQKSDVLDMLMYYDARFGTCFNGLFDAFQDVQKGYYPFKFYGSLYDCAYESRADKDPENIYSLCGVKENGKAVAIVTYYSFEEEGKRTKNVKLDFGRVGTYNIYALDKKHNGELVATTSELSLKLPLFGTYLIEEI